MADLVDMEAQASRVLGVSADELWEIVGRFDDLSWSDDVGRAELKEGDATRRTRFVKGADGEWRAHEDRLLEVPNSKAQPFAHAYSWAMESHPFGEGVLEDVVSTLLVNPEEDGKSRLSLHVCGKVHPDMKQRMVQSVEEIVPRFTAALDKRFNQ